MRKEDNEEKVVLKEVQNMKIEKLNKNESFKEGVLLYSLLTLSN